MTDAPTELVIFLGFMAGHPGMKLPRDQTVRRADPSLKRRSVTLSLMSSHRATLHMLYVHTLNPHIRIHQGAVAVCTSVILFLMIFIPNTATSVICLLSLYVSVSHVLSILPYKEEEEVAKPETEEKINASGESVKAAKHIIEYCIPSHYHSDSLGRTLFSSS